MANAVLSFLDARVAGGAADRPAIVTPTRTTSYVDLLRLACRAGHALRGLGVEAEQRVAMLLPDGVEWAAVFFGALRIGAVAVPLNTRLPAAACVEMLRDSRARVLVGDPALLQPLGPLVGALPRLKAVVTDAALLESAGRDTLPAADVSDDDMAFWLYTSGTTGGPKAAIHVHRNLLACRHYGLDVLGASESDRMLATSKLFFAYALGNALLIPLFVGARTFLTPRWAEVENVVVSVAAFRPTLLFSVPTVYARLLAADLAPDTFRSVRACVSAGERLPAEVYDAWRARFGVEILDGLGATETIFMVLSNRPGASRGGSVGAPTPGTEARLLDGDGHDVADGAPGVLHVRTPSASSGYWNRLEQTRRTFLGEWLRTGDVLTRDADGFHHHQGREDDLFKVAGLWVAPGDIEQALLGHPGVLEAGVVGAPEPGGLVKPFAFVVPRNGTPSDGLVSELTALAAARLAAHQRPRRISVVDELPRTATGKLKRFVLRERVARAYPQGAHE